MGKLSLEQQKGGSDRSTKVAAQKAVTKQFSLKLLPIYNFIKIL